MFEKIKNGDEIDLQVIEAAIMQSSFAGVKFLGQVSYPAAMGIDNNMNTLHHAFRPYFQDRYPDYVKSSDYDYVLVQHRNGTIQPLGLPWILASSIKVVTNKILNITVSNYTGMMEGPLRDLLANLGASYTFELNDRK